MRTMALDVGERRIGIAVSDPFGHFAQPYATLERQELVQGYFLFVRVFYLLSRR